MPEGRDLAREGRNPVTQTSCFVVRDGVPFAAMAAPAFLAVESDPLSAGRTWHVADEVLAMGSASRRARPATCASRRCRTPNSSRLGGRDHPPGPRRDRAEAPSRRLRRHPGRDTPALGPGGAGGAELSRLRRRRR